MSTNLYHGRHHEEFAEHEEYKICQRKYSSERQHLIDAGKSGWIIIYAYDPSTKKIYRRMHPSCGTKTKFREWYHHDMEFKNNHPAFFQVKINCEYQQAKEQQIAAIRM